MGLETAGHVSCVCAGTRASPSPGRRCASVLGRRCMAAVAAVLVFAHAGVCGASERSERPGKLPKIRVAADGKRFETAEGVPFVPFGVNYFRPGTGWAPQLWKQFDAAATKKDLALLKSMGGNCVRVFISAGSFYQKAGVLDEEGLVKFDQFLALAEEAGIYVHPTGPDHWEGSPAWARGDRFADDQSLAAEESFWRLFAARYKGRSVIFAYDLLNEPHIRWDTAAMRTGWSRWVRARYGSVAEAGKAWGVGGAMGEDIAAIPDVNRAGSTVWNTDYQRFREDVADEWTRRQSAAIRSVDAEALVTVGFIQWTVPALMPRLDMYAAFRPERQAKHLDFLEVHFYPLERGAYEYGNAEQEQRNLAYLEAVVREVARAGKPVVVAEFGWYGGGSFPMGDRQSKPGSEEEQARWCVRLIETTEGLAVGWLNWGFYDHPEAKDVTIHTGLLTSDGKEKAWGREFGRLAQRYRGRALKAAGVGARPDLSWDTCMTDPKAADRFREEYLKAFAAAKRSD